ncbi:MAG: OmpA family protein [Bacteroidales bacterium]|nr:OmpA family protein [Bacteroidales bacterium]
MKKFLLALAVVGLSTTAVAQQTEIPTHKYSVATNSFWANWYVSAGADFTAAYTSQENCCNKNPFSVDRGTFGFDVAVGKWFTPGIGLRTKFNGIWAKQVNTRDDHHSYNYWNIHEDVTFNLSNLLFGYNEKRVWNFIPYVGMGVMRNMNANEYALTYNFGLLNNFRVSSRVQIFADLSCTAGEGFIDGADINYAAKSVFATRRYDKLVGLSVGVTYNLGKHTWEKTPDVDALMAMNKEQLDALNASLKEQQDENARLRDMLANQKPVNKVETKTQVVTTAQSVFFNIGSSKIASRKDLVNVKEVAEYAKANGNKILVTGYADSKTGSAEFNKQLSEKRAQAVADELVKMGINRDNIITEAKGGVDTISPFSYNRRATVQIQ